jgi:hypothetical protein
MLGNVIYVNKDSEVLLLFIADHVILMHAQDVMLGFKYFNLL